MSLITCPECHQEISNRATSCPHCGNPMTGQSSEVMGTETKITSVQYTSKKIKKQWIIGVAAFIIGLYMFFIGIAKATGGNGGGGLIFFGFIIGLFGLVYGAVAEFRKWWHHG